MVLVLVNTDRYHRVKWEERNMADFTPINTQEELDRVLSSRLQRERETISKQMQAQIEERDQKITGYESQVVELNKRIEGYTDQAAHLAELESKIKGYETSSVKMRIAHEIGLPYELADRLSGADEKAIREDAETLKKLMGTQRPAPLKQLEDDKKDEKTAAWASVLQQMKGD